MNGKKILGILLVVLIVSSLNISVAETEVSYDSTTGDLTQDVTITIGPYPQNPSMNSTMILWQTSSPTSPNSVLWGDTPDCTNIVTNTTLTDLHKIQINELDPSKKYYYKVTSDTIESAIHTFYTVFEESETIKFCAYGDTRGVWDNWKNASIVAESIEREQPYFVLHTGDLVKDGRVSDQWREFFSISIFIHNCTLYPVLGNHEYYSDSFFQYFPIADTGYWYSFDYGSVHFIGLDSNKRNAYNFSQFIWLIKEVNSHNQPFTIVFFHHPPYSSGNHGSSITLRWLWGLIFWYYDVDIVFNGHDHTYERGKVRDVTYIVTGGGGGPLYTVGHNWWTIYSEKTYHYCTITATQDELSFQAKKPDGTVIDSFCIEK